LREEWWALYDPIAHVGLVRSVDPVLAKILQRAVKAVETLIAIPTLNGAVVHVVAELDVWVESAGRLSPSQRDVAAELGADVVANDQRVSVEAIWREGTELVLPQANDSA